MEGRSHRVVEGVRLRASGSSCDVIGKMVFQSVALKLRIIATIEDQSGIDLVVSLPLELLLRQPLPHERTFGRHLIFSEILPDPNVDMLLCGSDERPPYPEEEDDTEGKDDWGPRFELILRPEPPKQLARVH